MTVRTRSRVVDAWRGAAVVAMVLDHALVASGHGGSSLRHTVTRAAFPLFAVTAGAVQRRGGVRWERWLEVLAAGLVATALGPRVGLGQPDVMLLFAFVLPVTAFLPGWARVAVMCAGLIQPFTWPVPWGGYEPGALLGLVLVGQVVGVEGLGRWEGWAWMRWVGARPVAAYLGHVAVLVVLYGR